MDPHQHNTPHRCGGCLSVARPGCGAGARWAVGSGGAWPYNTQRPRPIGGHREACGAWSGNTQHQGTAGVKGAGGTCRGTRGRRRGLAVQRTDTPTDWRPPRGLRGLAGLRGAAPNDVRPPSLAGGRCLRYPEHQRRLRTCGAWPRCRWAAAGPGRASRSTTPSRQARVWRSRGRAAAQGHTKQPGPSTHTKTPTRFRVGVSEPPVGIEPTTYSLRVNRSAD